MGAVGAAVILWFGAALAEKPQVQELNRAILKIDNLSCGGCFSTINAGLSPLAGYSGMGANLFRKLVAIDFSPPLTPEKISQKLVDVGYPGKLEAVEPISEKESFAYLESKRTGFGAGGSCCSSGQGPGINSQKQGDVNQALPSGGSCCTLPGSSQPTQNF